MKGVILGGGFGKRLKPLTDTIPKPMITVSNRPIIEWEIKWLSGYGVKEFIICAGYKKEHIMDYFGNGTRFGVNVDYVIEEKPLGTGGALKNAENLLSQEKEFLMINGDILTNLDPGKLRNNKGIPAIALVPLRSSFGVVEVDDNSDVVGFVEKPIVRNMWINAGVYYLTKEVFAYLPQEGSLEEIVLPKLAKERKLHGSKYENVFWRSIDSHKDIEEATKEIQQIKM